MKYQLLDLIRVIKTDLLKHIATHRVAELEAWWILEKLTAQPKTMLITQQAIVLSQDQEEMLKCWLHQRIADKKPLQYILGSVPFCNLTILVKPPLLIPRPETEEMVSWLIETLKKNHNQAWDILDLCTGTGCIGLALAAAFPQAQITGVDINPQALKLAEENKAFNKITNITFLESDLFQKLSPDKKFDIIISNPPYLSEISYQEVSEEIRLWEDKNALVGNNNGMFFYEKIIQQAPSFLKKPTHHNKNSFPHFVLEIGINQDSIEKLCLENNLKEVIFYKDLQGRNRWITAIV
jgi:release factor glutamine methyltransferase